MMPNEASKEYKPKHDLESIADGMESEAKEPGMPDFMKDAEALLALEAKRDKMIDQKTELSKAGNVLELKPGVASGAIDKEIDALQDKINGVLGKYGKEANAFQVDAYRVGELKDNVADAEAMLKSMEAEYKSEKNPDKKKALERQLEDATAAWQEARGELAGMTDKYVAKEAAAKAELAGATEADIEAALEPLDRKGSTIEVGEVSDEGAEQIRDMDEMARDTEDALKMTMDASAEALKEKEGRQKAMAERVDARLKEEDENERELQASLNELQDIEKQRVREKAEMAKETDDAIKMAIETSAEALAEESKRDTLPDAGIAARMEKVAEDEEIETEEGELVDEPADSKAEDEFFKKGEVIDAVHGAGQTLDNRSAAERRGDAGAERQEMALEAEKLRSQMPEMSRQLARAEDNLDRLLAGRTLSAEERRLLGGEKVMTPGKRVDAFMSMRAKGGFAEKAKSFLGGLFSKKTRELNNAMDLYRSVLDQHNEMSDKLGKLDMQLNPTDRQKAMARIASENRQGR